MYPSQSDLMYEEEILRNPYSLKLWWRYLIAAAAAPFEKRAVIYERAVKALPTSYKLWHAYLTDRLAAVAHLPVTHPDYETLNAAFERALAHLHKFPCIWVMYTKALTEQRLITRARRTFDRALRALPVTQHDRIWKAYLAFVNQPGVVPVETALSVHRRYLRFDPDYIEGFVGFLIEFQLWQEAAERLAYVLNDDEFCSVKEQSKHDLWLRLCDVLTKHADEFPGHLNVDGIIRGGIRKLSDGSGLLWTSLAGYYIRCGLLDKARDVFEEGMDNVTSVAEFSLIFDCYSSFEESVISSKIETESSNNDEDGAVDDETAIGKLAGKVHGLWLDLDHDLDLRLARLGRLVERRPELLNRVLLRQNPHNVFQWHKRVKLFEHDPAKQILTYTEAVRTVDHGKAVGKPHTLWVAFALLYEKHSDLVNARLIFEKAVQERYMTVDCLATVWHEWALMECRVDCLENALELLRKATAEPSLEMKQRVAAHGHLPVQMEVHKSLRLWNFYAELMVKTPGCFGSARQVYERILDLKIATTQIILNYGLLLKENNYFEDAFKVYERGVNIFKSPHANDIWATYLTDFVERYKNTKLDRARDLFERAVEQAPAAEAKPLFLMWANFEEKYGLANRAMIVYDKAARAVSDYEKLSIYEIYIEKAIESFGPHRAREIYEQAIESGIPDKDVKSLCMKYAELEKCMGDNDRVREIYIFTSQFADPRSDLNFWSTWHNFEVQHGDEESFREMLRMKRSVEASFNQGHLIHLDMIQVQKRKLEDNALAVSLEGIKRHRHSKDENLLAL